MSKHTEIKWYDHTWSPWTGSPRVLAEHWQRQEPVRWNKRAERDYVAAAHSTKAGQPIRFDRPRVFPSLCDWLDEEVPIERLAWFLSLIRHTPNLEWLLLTKRPELWGRLVRAAIQYNEECRMGGRNEWLSQWLSGTSPNNVWVGASVEDQARANERIPELLNIPARVRFLSVEPMLGPVNLAYSCFNGSDSFGSMPGIDWVIVGGESGHGARPCNISWVRDIVRQCAAAGVPCFVKQLGSHTVQSWDDPYIIPAHFRVALKHPKGGDPDEWTEDLRVRQMPEVKP